MAADIKSHVLRRDEKGFMGIPFKRLLLGGVSGGMMLILARFAFGNLAFVLAALTFFLALTLTGPRGGIPLWQRLLYRARGSLMLAVERKPSSPAGRIGTSLDLPADLVTLDAHVVFAPPEGEVQVDMTEWVTFASAAEVDRDGGLVFMEKPLEEGQS
jgi:hypothetical protein